MAVLTHFNWSYWREPKFSGLLTWQTTCGNLLDSFMTQWKVSGSSGTTQKMTQRRRQSWHTLNRVIGENQSFLDSSHDRLPVGTHWTPCWPNGRRQEAQEQLEDDLKETAVLTHFKWSSWREPKFSGLLTWQTTSGNPLDSLLTQWKTSGSSGTTQKMTQRRRQSWCTLNGVIGENQRFLDSSHDRLPVVTALSNPWAVETTALARGGHYL